MYVRITYTCGLKLKNNPNINYNMIKAKVQGDKSDLGTAVIVNADIT